MENEDRSPVIHDKKTIQEVIRDWICHAYEYNDDSLGCNTFCIRDCPGKHAPIRDGGEDEGKKGQARADKEGDELPES